MDTASQHANEETTSLPYAETSPLSSIRTRRHRIRTALIDLALLGIMAGLTVLVRIEPQQHQALHRLHQSTPCRTKWLHTYIKIQPGHHLDD